MFEVAGCVGVGLGTWLFSATAGAQAPASGSFPIDERPAPAPSAAPTPAPPAATAASAPPAPAPQSAPTPLAAPGASPYAEPSPIEDLRDREYAGPRVSVTFSPLHLLLPMFEAQVELLVTPHLSISALGGIGSITAASTDGALADQKFSAWELGAQVVGYPLRDFSSLQLGAEFIWIHVSTENIGGQQISANAGGGAVGPLLGYKWLTNVGFTAFVQGGFEYVFVTGNAADDQGNTAQAKQSAVIPLLNFNVGWSF